MTDLQTKKLHDEVAKELFLDAIYKKQEPQASAVLAMVNAQIFVDARNAYWSARVAAQDYVVVPADSMPLQIEKGCNVCHGTGKFRPHGMKQNKPAPACKACGGTSKITKMLP